MSYTTYYGMSTSFAYVKEFGVDCTKKLGFNITCGHILYSAVPPLFSTILGLTGTLPSASFDGVLAPYNFEFRSELPSTFAKNTTDEITKRTTAIDQEGR